MIILTRGNKIIDIVQSTIIENNILVALDKNDNTVEYIKADTITQTEVETIPDNINSKFIFENGVFTEIKKKCFTKKEFLDLLSQEQVIEIRNSIDPNIQYFEASISMLPFIRTDNIQTQNGLGYLLQQGYITLQQYKEVL